MAERVSNSTLFDRALRSIAGGVNSPVRMFGAVGASPLFAARGQGPWLYDADGNRYVDHLMSWGAVMLGHAHPAVQVAIEKAARRGTGFGLSTSVEAELAELIKDAFPSVQLLRLVNSGTEAVMSAVRLARGYTNRAKVLKFEGCYHGHSDGLLARAGSGLATFGLPASAGVPPSFAGETLVARYNDLGSAESICEVHAEELACILVEPVAGNMGVVAPEPGFLEGLRKLCDRTGALLIFDEVVTGFRIAWGGAQERYGVRADLTTLGKVIGGGLPIGAFGGRRDIMERLAPLGDVYQAGTLSGNPVVAAAGKAALETLRQLNPYEELDSATEKLAAALSEAAQAAGVPVWVGRVGPMFTVFFTEGAVKDHDSAHKADGAQYARFWRALLGRKPGSASDGRILFPPSQWESAFTGTCHLQDDLLQATAAGCAQALHTAQQQPTVPVR